LRNQLVQSRDVRFTYIVSNSRHACAMRDVANHAGRILREAMLVDRSRYRTGQERSQADKREHAARLCLRSGLELHSTNYMLAAAENAPKAYAHVFISGK
jgi:hypothetical protein